MTALVEVHDEEEVDRAPSTPAPGSSASTPATCSTLEVDRDDVRAGRARDSRAASSRSPSPASAARTTCSTTPAAGADAVLVGEGLVTGDDPRAGRRRPGRRRRAPGIPRPSAGRAVDGAAQEPSRPLPTLAATAARGDARDATATSAPSAAASCPRR